MTVVIVAGSYYLAEQCAHDLGIPHPISRGCVVVTPNLSPRGLLGNNVTAIHAGPGAVDVDLNVWRELKAACPNGVWPGPATEPTWPQPEETNE